MKPIAHAKAKHLHDLQLLLSTSNSPLPLTSAIHQCSILFTAAPHLPGISLLQGTCVQHISQCPWTELHLDVQHLLVLVAGIPAGKALPSSMRVCGGCIILHVCRHMPLA